MASVYVIIPQGRAKGRGGTPVEARLAARASVLPNATCLYRWEGELRENPHTVPCMVAWSISGGNQDYPVRVAAESP